MANFAGVLKELEQERDRLNQVRWVSASLTQPLQIVVSGWF